jgi:hypothetical protein
MHRPFPRPIIPESSPAHQISVCGLQVGARSALPGRKAQYWLELMTSPPARVAMGMVRALAA